MSKEIRVNLTKISVAIAAVIAIVIGFIFATNNGAKNELRKIAEINKAEALKTLSYTQVDPTSEYVEGTNNEVKFSAYFVKDTDGDGQAERYLGACNSLSSTDALYFELGVEGNGYVESPAILIDGKNFKLSMTYFEDALVSSNLFSSDVTRINLKDLTSANGRILRGPIAADLLSSEHYSKDNNLITFVGTYVDEDGNRSTVRKYINLTVDWYGTASGRIKDGYTSLVRKAYIQDEEEEEDNDVDVNFSFSIAETSYELVMKQNIVEVTIPQCMGDDPVTATSSKGTATYDAASRKLRIEYDTTKRENNFVVTATYKQSTLNKLKNSDSGYKLTAPVKANIVCYNNPNMENVDNPYVTADITGNAVVSFDVVNDTVDANYTFDMQLLGTYVADQKAYVITKQPIVDQYGTEEVQPNIKYTSVWYVETTDVTLTEPETVVFEEGKGGDASKYGDTINGTVMDDYISYTGISIYNKEFIPADGYVRVYDEDTNELLKEFSGDDLVSGTPVHFDYETPVKHVKVVTSESTTEKHKFLRITNNKEIDVQKVTEDYTLDEVTNMTNLQTKMTGSLGNGLNVTGTRDAKLLGSACELNLRLSHTAITSTSKTENFTMYVDLKKDNLIYSGWKNGIFLVEIPNQIAGVDVKEISFPYDGYTVSGYEVYKKNGKTYIKIVTQNEEIANTYLKIVCDVTPNPLTTPGTISFYVYGKDEKGKTYWTSTYDNEDIDGNGQTRERIGYSAGHLYVLASEAFISASSLSNYNENEDVVYAPEVAVINKDTESARANIVIKNNYRANVRNVEILGKIPFKNNTYVGGGALGSTFTATMKNTGIQIPSGLQNKAVVYYTDVENPTKDITDTANKWKVSTEWDSLATVKSYLITIPTQQLSYGTGYTFTYDVDMPNDLVSNDKAYVAHKVYFELDTGAGWLATETQPAKVGMRVEDYYNLNAKKYKTGTNLGISGAVFKVWEKVELDEDSDNSRLVISDSNGNLALGSLVVNQTYYIKEIRVPDEYVLDSTVRSFKVVENAQHELSVQVLSEDGFVETPTMSKGTNDEDLLNLKFENDPKFELNITKIDDDTNAPISDVKFHIDGKDYYTGNDGKVSVKNLTVGSEYVLGEYQKDGYYAVSNVKFKVVKGEGNTYSFNLISGVIDGTPTVVSDDSTALVNVPLTITNKKVPTYSLKIEKVAINDENGEVTKIEGTKFLLRGEDSGNAEYITTDANGQYELTGLYQRVAGKDSITGKYTLTETEATAGYMLNNEDIEFYAQLDAENKLQLNIANRSDLTSINDVIVEGDKIKLVIEDKPVLKIRKVDSDTGAPLANAEFVINEINADGTIGDFAKDVEGNYIGTQNENGQYVVVTDSNGIITAALRDGKYRLTEIKAPDRYINAGATETFVVKSATKYESTDVEELPASTFVDNTKEIKHIEKIEDLLDVAIAVRNLETTYADTKIILDNDLDFTDRASYRNPDDSTTYGDINEDGNPQTLFEELGARDENGYGYGDGFPMIGGFASASDGEEAASQVIYGGNYPFKGIFDGNNKQIKNLYIANSTDSKVGDYNGLFRATSDALIKDLTVTGNLIVTKDSFSRYTTGTVVGIANNSYMDNVHSSCNSLDLRNYSTAYNGGLIGRAMGTLYMENCSYSGKNSCIGSQVGGLIGYCTSTPVVIHNCSNSGDIGGDNLDNGSNYHGGLVGQLSATTAYIYDCTNSGTVRGYSNGVAGIVGCLQGTSVYVNNCSNEGHIESKSYSIGGIVGDATITKMTNTSNAGAITGIGTNVYYIGGLIGQTRSNITVDNCYNKGTVRGEYQYIGGLIGNAGGQASITNSYNEGAVSGDEHVAGIVGMSYATYSFEDCYNLGRIEFKSTGAGLYGRDAGYGGTMKNCYNVGSIVATGEGVIRACGLAVGATNVENCYNKGDISINRSGSVYVSAIAYYGGNTMKDCYNTGNITITNQGTTKPTGYVYGIGYQYNIENCYNAGNIYISGNPFDRLDLFGIGNSCKNCYNIGNIENNAEVNTLQMAGIAYSTVMYCYNTGNLINNMNRTQDSTCTAYVGGISNSYSIPSGSYNAGNVYNIVTSSKYEQSTIKANPIYGSSDPTDSFSVENFALDTMEIAGKNTAAIGDYNGVTAVSDEYMRTEDFYDELVNYAGEDSKWVYRAGSYPTLDIAGGAPGQNNADFRIENQRNAFDITAEVALDGDNLRIGGETSGSYTAKYKELIGVKFIERVDAGEDSTQAITFTPGENYRVYDVSVNGESIGFAEESDGTVVIPAGYFTEVNEAKKVVVTFAEKTKLLTIEKVDKNDPTKKLQGAEFEINQIDERPELDGTETAALQNFGDTRRWTEFEDEVPLTIDLHGSYRNYTKGEESTTITVNAPQKEAPYNEPLKNSGEEYGFTQSGTTWVSEGHGLTSIRPHAYTVIDLSDKTGSYALEVSCNLSTSSNLYGRVYLTKTADTPTGSTSWINIYGNNYKTNSKTDTKYIEGGDTYYLHFVYDKGYGYAPTNDDVFTINSVKLYDASYQDYTMVQDGTKIKATNYSAPGTKAAAYTELDLSDKSSTELFAIEAYCTTDTSTQNTIGITAAYAATTPASATYSTKNHPEGARVQAFVNGGRKYYLYFINYNAENTESNSVIDDVKVYKAYEKKFGFEEDALNPGVYKSSNQGRDCKCKSLEVVDLTPAKFSGKYKISFDAQLTGSGAVGTAKISHYATGVPTTVDYTSTTVDSEPQHVEVTAIAGKKYTFQWEYTNPSNNATTNDDTLIISNFKVERDESELLSGLTAVTNEYGRANIILRTGKYSIVETKAPEDYILDETPIIREITTTSENIVQIPNETMKKVTAHYVEDTTDEKLKDDVVTYGVVGTEYETEVVPKIQKYTLKRNAVGAFQIPSNAKGSYGGESGTDDIEVTYRYETNGVEYRVHYFYDNVEDDDALVTDSAAIGTEISTYPDKSKTGYKLVRTENLPLTVNEDVSKNDIYVYYERKALNYEVHYFYDNVENASKAEPHNEAFYGDRITSFVDKNITGYVLDIAKAYGKDVSLDEEPLVIGETEEENIINVYYKKGMFDYTVRYYYDGVEDPTKSESGQAEYLSEVSTYTDKNITGYKLEIAKALGKTASITQEPLVITEDANQNIIDVYYVKDSFEYSIEYYYDDVIDNNLTVTGTAVYGSTIDTYEEKAKTGYKFHRVTGKPITISEVATNNKMKVYYIKDSFAYTVHYFYDNVEDATAVAEGSALYGASVSTYEDKNKTGYSLQIAKAYGKTASVTEDPLIIGTDTSKNVINVYYEKNSYAYTVKYYIDGEYDQTLDENGTALYGASISTYTDKTPTGYKLDKVNAYGSTEDLADAPLVIGTDTSKNIINVYYVKDSFGYSVRHFIDGVMDASLTDGGTALYGSEISTYTNKAPIGYKVSEAKTADRTGITGDLPLVITENAEDNLINVYYIPDELGYTIHYFYDGVEDVAKKVSENSTIGTTISTYPDKNITGYKLEIAKVHGKTAKLAEEPLVIGTDTEANRIDVYYVKDNFEYTVKYFVDGVEKPAMEYSDTAKYQSVISTYTDKCPEGCEFEKTEGVPLTISHIVANNVIKVYYVRQQGTITVTYVDNLTGEEIIPGTTKTGPVGDPYHIDRQDIPGYRLDEDNLPDNEDGTYPLDGDTVVYTYIELRPYELEVRYTADTEEIEEAKINVTYGDTTIDDYTSNRILKIKDIELTELGEETYTVFESYTPQHCKTIVSEEDPGVVKLIRRINDTNTDYEFVPQYEAREGFNVIIDKTNKKVIIDIKTEVKDKYDLALQKFITKIGNTEITSREPEVVISDDNKISYKKSDEIEKAINSQKIVYTIRMYNESEQEAKGKRVIEYVPEGLVFVPGDITNTINEWHMYKVSGNNIVETTNPAEAKLIVTDVLVDRTIAPFDSENKQIYSADVQAVFRVDESKIVRDDRIVENKVEIQKNINDDNTDNDTATEKVYVKYFDLKMEKYIEKVVINTNGNETVKEYGYEKKDDLVKIDVKKSQVPNTTITVTYGLKVSNVGEIPGYATELTDYMPENFSLVSDKWEAKGGKAVFTELADTVIEPGESLTTTITLEWKLAKGTIGLKSNEAEITGYTNDYEAEDVTKDNKDKADLLVTVKTGSNVIAIVTIITVGIGLLAILAYKKRLIDDVD